MMSRQTSRPMTTSTSFMTGTGLKKCMPMKRWGSLVRAASLVMPRYIEPEADQRLVLDKLHLALPP